VLAPRRKNPRVRRMILALSKERIPDFRQF
jgi:hypothetical protein